MKAVIINSIARYKWNRNIRYDLLLYICYLHDESCRYYKYTEEI